MAEMNAPLETRTRQEEWSIWARQFIPAFFICLREGYSLKTFWSDCVAGVGLVLLALPLNMAFAIACGLAPEYGLYTGIVAGALAAIFGGSPVAIGGPTGSFVVIIFTLLEQHGYAGVATATCMAGMMLILMALIGCGQLLQLVSYPVIRGFTSGIAVVIMGLQVRDFLGLHPADPASSHFITMCLSSWGCLETFNPVAIAVGMTDLVFLIAMRYFPRFPAYPVVVFVSAALVSLFALPVETVGSRFGGIPDSLPFPSFPDLSWHAMQPLFSPAFTIAMLCALESLLCAVVADEMAGTRHSSNGELLGQGIANIGSIFFQGFPAAGAIARTAANIRMGAKTPMASLVHVGVILLVVLFFAHYMEKIPLTTLAAMLIVVAWQMSEFGRVRALFHAPKRDLIVFFVTFFLTIFVDLTVAVEVGVLLSIFFFIQQLRDSLSFKAYQTALAAPRSPALAEEEGNRNEGESENGNGNSVEFLTLQGPLFFGIADSLQEAYKQIKSAESGRHSEKGEKEKERGKGKAQSKAQGKVLIVRMGAVPFVDASGIQALFELKDNCARSGMHLLLAEVNENVRSAIQQADREGRFGENGLFTTLHEAVEAAHALA